MGEKKKKGQRKEQKGDFIGKNKHNVTAVKLASRNKRT